MRIGAISPVSAYGGAGSIYPMYPTGPVTGVRGAGSVNRESDGVAQATVDGAKDASNSKRIEQEECQTCKNRKYVDGSNDGNVSFKSPAHIDPNNAAAAVMSHEQEHVANAVAEGNEKNKELVNVSVTLKTSVCPECGRVYVSGGTTNTTMRTTSGNSRKTNPYEQLQANLDYLMGAGKNMDLSA